ncbi:Uncharacterised protein [Raoultella terrigena]|uniref:Uncharacterized protein n=1 Tax=Raoultella terrigena TaxID=577 RepID=A0A3P8M3F6_RAOTE|nr:Uncharacterised protein [Raoultella terrigena]
MLEKKWFKNFLFLLSVVLICIGVFSTLNYGPAAGTVIIATGFGIIIITQFDWNEIKVPGLEAKLRNTINDAEIILESLRKISLPISEVSISLAARTGRWDTATSNEELHKLVKSISLELESIGVSEKDILQVKQDWFYYTTWDMCQCYIENIHIYLKKYHDELQNKYDNWVGGKPISDLEKQRALLSPLRLASEEIQRLRNLLWQRDYKEMPSLIDNFLNDCNTLTLDEKNQSALKMKIYGLILIILYLTANYEDLNIGLKNLNLHHNNKITAKPAPGLAELSR